MMACSYLSAGGLKSEPTSAACWSPPAMAGCHAAQSTPMALPTVPMTLPTPSMALPSGTLNLQSISIGLHDTMELPRTPMNLPPGPMALPSSRIGLSSGSVGIPNLPMRQTSVPVGLTSRQLGQTSMPVGMPARPMVPNTQMGLTPPFARPLPLDLHKSSSQTDPPASEPALDLSASATPMTPSLKSRLPTLGENE